MSAERGWIGDPQPSVEWRDSHYSRTLQKLTEEIRPSKRPRMPSCTRSTTVTSRPCGSTPGIPLRGRRLRGADKSRGTDCLQETVPKVSVATVACAAPHRSNPKKLKRTGIGPCGLLTCETSWFASDLT
jgi:hypothetical protein